jgi:methionine-S-sulfoxide reductase
MEPIMKKLSYLFVLFVSLFSSLELLAQENFEYQFNTSISHKTQMSKNREFALLAGGCFWCIEAAFDGVTGVSQAISGYAGGSESQPQYKEVAGGLTGHREAVWIVYDPTEISYEEILNIFWKNIDPTQADGQFADIGHHYQTAIFPLNEEQSSIAERSKQEIAKKFKKPIATEVLAPTLFWPAENSHQNFHLENKAYYQRYKEGSGRAGFIKKTWGK